MSVRPEPAGSPERRYVIPTTPTGRLMGRLFNGSVAALTRRGIRIWGSRVLYVRGRKSGEWRSTPVNPLTFEGQRYLVAPDEKLLEIAPGYPVFHITARPK